MATSTTVFDASALVRAFVAREAIAAEWVERVDRREVVAWTPEHAYLEVASALWKIVRAGSIEATVAAAVLRKVGAMPLRVAPVAGLAEPALALGLASGLSVYDAAYLVLARARDATLVTADRRLAEHHDRVALLA